MRDIDKLENMLWGCMKLLETIKIEMGDYAGHEELADGELITGSQCRGARNMILMRNSDLAELADIGTADLSKFETRVRNSIGEKGVLRIRKALESKGLVFYADGSVGVKEK
jgi:hypothetical protein